MTHARYDEACPRPGSLGFHSDSYGDDGDGHCRFCGASPPPPEPRPADFFASLPVGTVVELRSEHDSAGRATLTIRR